MPKLIVGLGNAGKKYEKTRHNVGFFIVDRLARRTGCEFSRKKFHSLYSEFLDPREEKVFLIKPQTLMNLSGESVAPWLDFLKPDGRDVLVIHDDLDLPLGRIRGQWAGGSAGNNGVASIVERLGHPDFCRLRFGIGHPGRKSQVVSYVLSPFNQDELETAEREVERATDGAELFIEKGLDPMMQVVNKKVKIED